MRTLGIETPRTVEHTGTRYVRTGTHQKTELADNKNSVSKKPACQKFGVSKFDSTSSPAVSPYQICSYPGKNRKNEPLVPQQYSQLVRQIVPRPRGTGSIPQLVQTVPARSQSIYRYSQKMCIYPFHEDKSSIGQKERTLFHPADSDSVRSPVQANGSEEISEPSGKFQSAQRWFYREPKLSTSQKRQNHITTTYYYQRKQPQKPDPGCNGTSRTPEDTLLTHGEFTVAASAKHSADR